MHPVIPLGRNGAAGKATMCNRTVPLNTPLEWVQALLLLSSLGKNKYKCRFESPIFGDRPEHTIVCRHALPVHTSVIHIAMVSSGCSTMNRIISSYYFPCCLKTALGKIKPLRGARPITLPGGLDFLHTGVGGWWAMGRIRGPQGRWLAAWQGA